MPWPGARRGRGFFDGRSRPQPTQGFPATTGQAGIQRRAFVERQVFHRFASRLSVAPRTLTPLIALRGAQLRAACDVRPSASGARLEPCSPTTGPSDRTERHPGRPAPSAYVAMLLSVARRPRGSPRHRICATARNSSGLALPKPKNSRQAGIISKSMSLPTWITQPLPWRLAPALGCPGQRLQRQCDPKDT